MPPIGYLARQWCAECDPTGIFRRAIARHHLDTGMCLEPAGKCKGRAVGQEIDRLSLLKINKQRSIVSPFALGKIINAEHAWRERFRYLC